ncbi:MAG: hypothetical protein JNM31_08495 [Flavobacteriales bacterium]|nr:hypothetical protein [Flavobacteriales bacterium]
MQDIWFAIARLLMFTFDALLVPFGWMPVTAMILVMAFGAIYWLMLQGRYNRRAKERNEMP